MIRAASIVGAGLLLADLVLAQPQGQPVQRPTDFRPARLTQFSFPAATPPNTIAGGEVLVEAVVSPQGIITKAVPLRITPAYTQLVLDSLSRWQFQAAIALNTKGLHEGVVASILVAAVYRSTNLLNAPTIGSPPKDTGSASREIPFPVGLISPAYPLKTVNVPFGRTLFEVQLGEQGQIQSIRHMGGDAGFEAVSAEALRQWRFRPSTFRGLPATSIAYVFFGFPAPVLE